MDLLLYNATAELATKARLEEIGEDVVTALEGYHPAAGRSPFGRVEVTISLPAESLRQAVTTALSVIETSTGLSVAAIEVLTTDDFDRRNGLDPVPGLLSVSEAAAFLAVSRQRVLQLVDAGALPAVKIGKTLALHRTAVEVRAAETGRSTSDLIQKFADDEEPTSVDH